MAESDGSTPSQAPDRPAASTPGKRALWSAILLTVAGAAALWAASSVHWLNGQYRTPFQGVRTAGVAGSAVRPELVPLALVALAALAAVLATAGVLRRVVGVLVALAGGLLAWRAASWWFGGEQLGVTPDGLPAGSVQVGAPSTPVWGPGLALLGAVFVLAGGIVVMLRAQRMPGMGARYSAPGSQQKSHDPDKRLWDELSEGHDPTAEAAGGRDPNHPW